MARLFNQFRLRRMHAQINDHSLAFAVHGFTRNLKKCENVICSSCSETCEKPFVQKNEISRLGSRIHNRFITVPLCTPLAENILLKSQNTLVPLV